MGLLDRLRRQSDEQKFERTGQAISAALTNACEGATRLDLERTVPLIIFSDHHKGARDGADDFQRSERTYNAALTYYRALDYHLVELGDVEELWENGFDEVVSNYATTLALAAEFQKAGRYHRVFGNHDLVWKNGGKFKQRMAAVHAAYASVEPVEAIRLVVDDDELSGEIFLLHGHQGTADSDRNAKLSQFLVRHGWRPLQALLARPWNTPSVDWALRGEHALHMSTWASERNRVLIAGHTHMPVFYGNAPVPATPSAPGAEGGDARVSQALVAARQAWVDADKVRLQHQASFKLDTPCYFNTGCCSFGDGDITGIELAENEIRLVRWPCSVDTAPQIKARLPLKAVFEQAKVAPPPDVRDLQP